MKLVLHLARTELWRLRWWPLGWLVLQVPGLVVLGTGQVSFLTGFAANLVDNAATLSLLWAYFLSMDLWCEGDPTRGDRFWQTRPIGTAEFAASRLLVLVVLLFAIPVIISAPFWLAWQASSADLLSAFAQFGSYHGGGALLAFAIGLFTPPAAKGPQRLLFTTLALPLVALLGGGWVLVLGWLWLRNGVWVASPEGHPWMAFLVVLVLVTSWLSFSRRTRLGPVLILCGGVCVPLLAALLLRPPIPAEVNAEAVRSVLGDSLVLKAAKAPDAGAAVSVTADLPARDREECLTLFSRWGFLEQDGRVYPNFLGLSAGSRPDDARQADWLAAQKERRLRGFLGETNSALFPFGNPDRVVSPLDATKPIRVCAVLEAYAERREIVLDADFDVDAGDKALVSSDGEWQVGFRHKGASLELWAVRAFRLQGGEGPEDLRAMLHLEDAGRVQILPPRASSGWNEVRTMGMTWRAKYVRARPPSGPLWRSLSHVSLTVIRTRPVGRLFVDTMTVPYTAPSSGLSTPVVEQ